MFRRRGFRGRRGRAQGGQLAEKLRKLTDLGLRDLRALERPPGTPDVKGSLDVPDESLGKCRFCHYAVPPKERA